ncbi:MAG: hypothetical protein IT269_03110 [Saprospiraceae bacterium]|nr:hypothetical protein [Saprospiraceae bacterium]
MQTIHFTPRAPLALLLMLIFVTSEWRCMFYERYPLPISRIRKIDLEALDFYLYDPSAVKERCWYVSERKMDTQSMTGYVSKLTAKEAADIYNVRSRRDALKSRNEVLFFLKPEYARTLPDTGALTLDFRQIDHIEVYEVNHGKTMMASIAIVPAGMLLITVIALGDKESCPFIYACNPDETVFQGEIFAGAVYPQLERNDWLPLPDIQPKDGAYNVRIANKAREIQHTDLMAMEVIDHPENTEVLYDQFGTLHCLADVRKPLSVEDFQGRDQSEKLAFPDEKMWTGAPESQRERADEGLVVRFPKPENATTGRLVIRAKNSIWLDYLYGQFLNEFGEYGPMLREQTLKRSKDELNAWMNAQNMPLKVSVETSPGVWTPAGAFQLAGPMALKRDVLPIDLSAVQGKECRIRLECGYMFWEIDEIGLDCSTSPSVKSTTVLANSATDQNGADVLPWLTTADGQYYTQAEMGNEATVRFPAPPLTPGMKRSCILKSRGHYERLREPMPGKPSLLYLKQFEKPDALPKYSRSRWHEWMRNLDKIYSPSPS